MSILIGFLYVIEVCVCLLLAGIVMLQKPKEGGLGGVIGGGMAEAAFGADAAPSPPRWRRSVRSGP